MNQVFSYFDNEALYPALDVDAAVSISRMRSAAER